MLNNFSIEWREKNNLGDLELDLLWNYVKNIKVGRVNFKQHYLAWVLAWITGVRPGSYTICSGYEKGALLADGTRRMTHETLLWSDCQFFRDDNGEIGIQITFRYSKGFRSPHTQKLVEGARTFTIFMLNG